MTYIIMGGCFFGGRYKEGSEGTDLYEGLKVVSDNVFVKHRSDAFSEVDFEQYLIDREIDTLYITGAMDTACVYKTVLGAENRKYNTIILEDCVFSLSDKLFNKMKQRYEKSGIDIKIGM